MTQTNGNMEKELRHSRSKLWIFGTGVIAFTLWSIIRPLLILLFPTGAAGLAAEAESGITEKLDTIPVSPLFIALALLFLLLVFFLVIGLRFYIGFSARAEGVGRHRGSAYVVIAFVFFAFQVLSFALTGYYLFKTKMSDSSVLETAAAVLVEVSSMVTMGEMAFEAVKVKKLTRQMRKAG